jgi:glycogen synthase
LLAHAVCLAQPSRHEGFSVSLIEALASGTPIVVSSNIDLPGLLESRAGKAVPLEAAPIAGAILGYAGSRESRELIAKRARHLVRERYTWDRIARQVTADYLAQPGQELAGRGIRR